METGSSETENASPPGTAAVSSSFAVIPTRDVAAAWSEARPLIEKAIARGDGGWRIFDVFNHLMAGHSDLWVTRRDGKIEAAMVGMVVDYPAKRVYMMTFIGGTGLNNWIHYEDVLADWARARNCSALDMSDARNGAWARVLPHWRPLYTALRLDL